MYYYYISGGNYCTFDRVFLYCGIATVTLVNDLSTSSNTDYRVTLSFLTIIVMYFLAGTVLKLSIFNYWHNLGLAAEQKVF